MCYNGIRKKEGENAMKIFLILWVCAMLWFGVSGIIHRNDTDKDDNFKTNWRLIIMSIMFPITPIIAKICGLI